MVNKINGHTVTPIDGSNCALYRCTECEKSLSDPDRFTNVDCVD